VYSCSSMHVVLPRSHKCPDLINALLRGSFCYVEVEEVMLNCSNLIVLEPDVWHFKCDQTSFETDQGLIPWGVMLVPLDYRGSNKQAHQKKKTKYIGHLKYIVCRLTIPIM
jgi:hypothetical protein